MTWFVIDEKALGEMKVSYDAQKFNELVKKEILTNKDVIWLHKNGLLEMMAMAKGGIIKATFKTMDWRAIYGHDKG